MKITLKKLSIQNFKGCTNLSIDFKDTTTISGRNASGKSTVFDAFTFLLFGKNARGEEKFAIRPVDAQGNKIHNIEIVVEGEFLWEYGEASATHILKKTVKEKWVKKRGTGTAELQGNETIYEVDGYPRSEREYKEIVSSWIDEGLFKILTNPQHFPNMPWKEQRDVLMLFVGDRSDADIAREIGGFEDILDELEKAPSTDDILTKYKKSANELKKTQAELPIRIDEASKQKVDFDLAELELARKALSEQIAEREKAGAEWYRLNVDLSNLGKTLNAEASEKKAKLSAEYADAKSAQAKLQIEKHNTDHALRTDREMLTNMERQLNDLAKQQEEAANGEFDVNNAVCATCGQMLPKDKVESRMADFEARKKATMERVERDSRNTAELIKTINMRIADNERALNGLLNRMVEADKHLSDIQAQIEALPAEIVVEETPEYRELKAKIESIGETDTNALTIELKDVEAKILLAGKNAEIDERIAELQKEQREVGQKVMDCEKVLFQVETFIRKKMELVSSEINKHFDGVAFNLFELQINGALKETCEATIDGVPYASANNGHRIIAGLNIIKALQNLMGVYAPVFVDNSECVNDYNYPAMECQTVFLKVTDDAELTVS